MAGRARRGIVGEITKRARATDIVARYGGEELAVILRSTEIAGAAEAAEKIRSAVAALHFPHEGHPGGGALTASVGAATAIARLGASAKLPSSLLLAADTAMYKAKNGGRNRVATALVVAAPTS